MFYPEWKWIIHSLVHIHAREREMSMIMSSTNREMKNSDEEDRINLQALQNRDPYITKIIDQAQRVCVYKFLAEKREWVNSEEI